MTTFFLEMLNGQARYMDAHFYEERDGWLIFSRRPAEGGRGKEYWRVRVAHVISMETKQ